ncbi:MAG: hypothetical protein AAF206_18190 [Bacteroidota bacterium]
MKKIWFAALLIFGMSIQQSQAQFADKLVPHVGFMYEFSTAFDGNQNVTWNNYYNLHLGSYVALWHKNDIVSVGIDPSVQVGFRPIRDFSTNNLRFDWNVQVPVYLMARIGANATPYNSQKAGFSLGVGANYSYYNQFNNNFTNRFRSSYINPAGVVEVTILSRGNPITGRFHFGLSKTTSTRQVLNTNGDVLQEVDFPQGFFGVGLLYGF